ncbi:MAG: RNA polymerase sigma factor RpoD/SigA [Candidatus Aegiribacteria sp.]
MTPEEEKSLVDAQERYRKAMLESILAVPLGRRMFLQPLRRLAEGEAPRRDLVDGSYWGISGGVLPESRRERLKGLLERIRGRYLKREVVLDLHLLWHSVESLGEELFAGIGRYRELLVIRNRMMDLLKDETVPMETLATCFDLLEETPSEASRLAWRLYPGLSSIRNCLDLLEVSTGTGIFRYSDAAKRFHEAVQRTRDVIERFVEANLGLVISKVGRFYPCDVMEEMDLIQEGCQGLMEAVRRFDHTRGCKLSTFAVWWIRQYLMKAVIRQGRLVRIPVSLHYGDSSIRRAIDEFAMERGQPPTVDELAEHMGRDVREIEEIYLSTAVPLSLDHTGSEHDATIADFLVSRFQSPDRRALRSETRERIDAALKSLSDREKTIITLRFGLMDGEPCTLEQLGRVFGISRERVRQIERRALARLRKHGLITTLESGRE